MARKNQDTRSVAEFQPDELNALKDLVKEFVGKMQVVDNEIETLKEDRKEIIEEYSSKLDYRTLQAAMKVVKIQNGVAHKDTYDTFLEVLTDHT